MADNNTFNEVEERNKANERHLQHWRNIQAIVNAKIAESQTVVDGKPSFRTLTTKELKDIVAAMREAVIGERNVLGLPNNVSRAEQEIKLHQEFADFSDDELDFLAKAAIEQMKTEQSPTQ